MESSSNSDSDSGTSSDTSSEGISSSDSDDLEEEEEEDQSIEESEDDDSDSESEAQHKSNNQVCFTCMQSSWPVQSETSFPFRARSSPSVLSSRTLPLRVFGCVLGSFVSRLCH